MGWKLFKNSIEPTNAERLFWDNLTASIGLGEYSDLILKLCVSPIFDELKKVEFFCNNPQFEQGSKKTIDFLNKKYAVIYKYLFMKGFCAVKIDSVGNITFDDRCVKKTISEYESELSNKISVKTFEYDFFGKSQSELLFHIFDNVNVGLTAQKAVTKILGQFTIFNKEVTKDNERPSLLSDAQREEFTSKFNNLFTGNNVGTAVEFTNANLKRDTILFPLDKLQIVDQVTFCILLIAGTLNVPYDLIPLTGKSTYANQDAAKQYLRQNTVNGIAENMLELGRNIITSMPGLIPKSAIEYKFIDTLETTQVQTQN